MTVTKATEPHAGESRLRGTTVFGDILCAIDGTRESFAAVEQAAVLAGPIGHVTLLEVTSFEAEGAEGAARSPAIAPAQATATVERAVGILEKAGVPHTVEVDPANPPSRVVLDWAVERDLLALGAPGTSWLGGMFRGGVAVTAEGSFTTPLLVARSMPTGRHFARHILVASDGLAGSDELVELAGDLARAQGADVTLLHATGFGSKARRRRVEEQARRLQLAVDGASEVRFEAGSARTVIVEMASAVGASLVVMSSRRLKGLRVIGSVSRRVVHQGHCSVLLLPPELLQARATRA
jgi:nucleotide-binding universal stress UspA family protein